MFSPKRLLLTLMTILTQVEPFVVKWIQTISPRELKHLLNRQRLKFTTSQIVDYIMIIFKHTVFRRSFLSLYKARIRKGWRSLSYPQYSCFMSHIALFSKLFPILFQRYNQSQGIRASRLMNITDTSLIPAKESRLATSKDWKNNRVTSRSSGSQKYSICGSKASIWIHRFGTIYSAKLMSINNSDMNILKDCAQYRTELQGFLLADRGDRGDSCKNVRKRLEELSRDHAAHDPFHPLRKLAPVRLISPYRLCSKIQLIPKKWKLYKRRWAIETVFQRLKAHHSETPLSLKGSYSKVIKNAPFFSALTLYHIQVSLC